MYPNYKTKTSQVWVGWIAEQGICVLCQLVAIEKSDFIHVLSECQWRNSLTRAGIWMTLWMASHKKGECLGRRGLWTIIDWTGERGNGQREVEDGKHEGKKKGDEARVASLWARKGWRPVSPRIPEASLAAIDLYMYLWLSHLPFPPPDCCEFQRTPFLRKISLALSFYDELLHLSAFAASTLLPC